MSNAQTIEVDAVSNDSSKRLYGNLQMSEPWCHCTMHIHSELCMGVHHLLNNYEQKLTPNEVTSQLHR